MDEVIVIGGGGHAKVVVATLFEAGYRVCCIYDDARERWGRSIMGVPVVGAIDEISGYRRAVIAIGDNVGRRSIAERLDLDWLTVVHPRAYVDSSVSLGCGTVVLAGAVVQPDVRVGSHVIVNTGATVDHDSEVGDYVHIGPGAHLAGSVFVGSGTLIGVGSAVLPGIRVGAWAIVGAGSVVTRDIPDGQVAFGVPAKPRRSVCG